MDDRMIQPQVNLPLRIGTLYERRLVVMSIPSAESCQGNRTASYGFTGAIVLSSSSRLLFIDRTAIDLLSTLDPDWRTSTEAQPLPLCLMTMVQDISATHSTLDKDRDSPSAHISRFLGSRSHPVRVQAFTVPCQEQQDNRVVLVLSRSSLSTPQHNGVRP
jgi:hypothetical protein